MHPISFLTAFSLLTFCFPAFSQRIATLEIELLKPTSGLSVPAKVDLDAITFLPDSVLSLVEIQGNNRSVVPFQVDNNTGRTLYCLFKVFIDKAYKRYF